MKKCPTCEKIFDNSLRFCQSDGTPLVEITDNAPDDPYKTTVGRQSGFTPETPVDPFATMVGGSFKKEDSDNLLQLPEESQDPLKTMFISDEEMKKQLAANEPEKEKIIEVPPLAEYSSPVAEKKDSPQSTPPPPSFNAPPVNSPNFGSSSSSESPSGSSPFKKPSENMSSSFSSSEPEGLPSIFNKKTTEDAPKNPFDSPPPFKQPNAPIPSPFDDAKPTSFNPPSAPLPTYKEPDPSNVEQNNPFSQTPFGQHSMPVGEPLQQTEWTPPPVPDSNWQNQSIGANTPFQPPGAAGGQNQTLAIVSLVLGIIGIVFCQLTGPAAVITGLMARKKAANNPAEYGGSGLALAGIITGVIGTVLLIFVLIYIVFIFGLVATQSF